MNDHAHWIGPLLTGHCTAIGSSLTASAYCIRASAHYRLHRLTRLLTASACCVGSLDGSLRRLFMWCASVHCSVSDAGPASVRTGLSCSHWPLTMPEQDTRLDSLACSAAASVQLLGRWAGQSQGVEPDVSEIYHEVFGPLGQ